MDLMFMRYSSNARYMLSDVLDRLDGILLVCGDLHLVESCKYTGWDFRPTDVYVATER